MPCAVCAEMKPKLTSSVPGQMPLICRAVQVGLLLFILRYGKYDPSLNMKL